MLDTQVIGLPELLKATNPDVLDKSLVRAMRAALQSGRTQISRRLRIKLALKLRQVNTVGSINIRVGGGAAPSSIILVSPSIPLSEFAPVKTSRGYSIKLVPSGGRTNLVGAFQMPGANQRLFRRTGEFSVARKGRYKGKRREQISQMFTRSLPQVVDDQEDIDEISAVIADKARGELLRLLQVFGGDK